MINIYSIYSVFNIKVEYDRLTCTIFKVVIKYEVIPWKTLRQLEMLHHLYS